MTTAPKRQRRPQGREARILRELDELLQEDADRRRRAAEARAEQAQARARRAYDQEPPEAGSDGP